MLRRLYIGAASLYFFTACRAMDELISTPSGEIRVGDAVAGEVEAYTPAVTDAVSTALTLATGNPILGGAVAAALLGVSAFAVKKLRKEPPAA